MLRIYQGSFQRFIAPFAFGEFVFSKCRSFYKYLVGIGIFFAIVLEASLFLAL